MSDDLTTLEGTERAVWATLANGVADANTPARTIALATQSLGGGGAVRMVVLRAIDREAQTLTVYTHRASNKVSEIVAQPRVEALVWDAERQFQIRLEGEIESAPGPQEIWDSFGPGTRNNYARKPVPGSPIASPDAAKPEPDPDTFILLTLRIKTIETLWLTRTLQRRARFTSAGAEWIAP